MPNAKQVMGLIIPVGIITALIFRVAAVRKIVIGQ